MGKRKNRKQSAKASKEKLLDTIKKEKFQWRIDSLDLDFPEDLEEHLNVNNLATEIIPKLQQHEQEAWGSMYTHPKHHFVKISESDNPAPLKRLQQSLDVDRIGDTLFSFRISGERRLFGFVEGKIFYALWYDHNHQLFPSKKKNT